jgi:MFS family permease
MGYPVRETMAGTRLRQISAFLGLRRDVAVLLVAIILMGFGEETWSRFLPKYLDALGATAWTIGLFDALKTFASAVYAWPGGILADRWGYRSALLAFSAISVIGYVVLLLFAQPAGVIAGTLLYIAWTYMSLPAMFSLVGAALPASKHTMGIGVQSLIRRLPVLIGPVAGGMLIDRWGVATGVRTGLLVSVVAGLVTIWIQARFYQPAGAPEPAPADLLTLIGKAPPEFRRLLFSDILVRFCERIPFAWVVIYAMDHLGVSATQIGLLTAIEMIAAIACYVPTAHLADRYGKEPFVIATFGFFTAFPLALLLARDFRGLVIAFLIRGLKEFGDPARKALIIGYAPPALRGRLVGAYYLIRDVLVSGGALVGAFLWSRGPEVNFVAAAATGVIGTLIYATSLRSLRRNA